MAFRDPRSWMWVEACISVEQAERTQRQFFEPNRPRPNKTAWEPPVDIFESGHVLWVIFSLPGVGPEDMELILEGNTLIVTGRRKLPPVARGAAIHRLELAHGQFERRIVLPARRWRVGQRELTNGCLLLSLQEEV